MIDDTILSQMASSLIAGKYNLFLGSGVSLDSSNSGGKLPSASKLRDELCSLKGVHKTSSLQRVFSTLTYHERQTHVIDRFKSCTPGATLIKLREFNWKRVFTLNIDDALESAYALPKARQEAVPIHFNQDYVEERETHSACALLFSGRHSI